MTYTNVCIHIQIFIYFLFIYLFKSFNMKQLLKYILKYTDIHTQTHTHGIQIKITLSVQKHCQMMNKCVRVCVRACGGGREGMNKTKGRRSRNIFSICKLLFCTVFLQIVQKRSSEEKSNNNRNYGSRIEIRYGSKRRNVKVERRRMNREIFWCSI